MAGIPPWRFWTLTRGELAIAMKGAAEVADQRRRRELSLAWHTAALTRSRRRMPSLKRLIEGPLKPEPVADPVQAAIELAAAEAALEEEEARNRAAMAESDV